MYLHDKDDDTMVYEGTTIRFITLERFVIDECGMRALRGSFTLPVLRPGGFRFQSRFIPPFEMVIAP